MLEDANCKVTVDGHVMRVIGLKIRVPLHLLLAKKEKQS